MAKKNHNTGKNLPSSPEDDPCLLKVTPDIFDKGVTMSATLGRIAGTLAKYTDSKPNNKQSEQIRAARRECKGCGHYRKNCRADCGLLKVIDITMGINPAAKK